MEWERAIQWVERNATIIATIEFGVLVLSGLGAFFGWFIMRGRHNDLIGRHRTLLSRLDQQDAILKELPTRISEMIGKPEAEQKKIAAKISHAVNAGSASHEWSTSQPSVTHRRASEKDTCDDV